jgi:hypothetical protein
MRFIRWLEPGGRLVARHLRRLCDNLQDLGVRLRDAIASAVGQSAGSAVQEVVGTLLAQREGSPQKSWSPRQSHRYPEDGWYSNRPFDDRRWPDDRDALYDPPPEEDDWNTEPDEQAVASSSRGRWLAVLAVGLQTAAWWLRQRAGRFTFLAALGCGLVAALVACGFGTVAVAGASLLSLLGLLQAGADLVSAFTP